MLCFFSQNIDGLERMAGISKDRLYEVHGSMEEGFCQKCFEVYTKEEMRGTNLRVTSKIWSCIRGEDLHSTCQ